MARAPGGGNVINIAPELEREGRVSQGVQPPPSDGLSDAFLGRSGLAAQFSQLAGYVGGLADHAAQVEGGREGHLAGLDPEFRTRQDGTIRGEAFDRAGLDTAKARVSVEIHNEIEQAALKHRANPQALAKLLAERQGGWEKNIPAELLPEVRTAYAKGSTAAFRQATRELWHDQAEQQKGATQAELERLLRSTQQTAYAGGLDDDAVRIAADNVGQLQRVLSRRGPDGKPLVAPAAAAKLVADAKEVVARSQLEGAFDRLPDAEAKQRFIQRLDEDFAKSQGVAAAFDFQTFQSVKGHLETGLRRSLAANAEGASVLRNAVKEVERRATAGEPVQQAELAALQSRVVQSGNGELQAQLDDGIDSLRFMQSFKTLPVPAMEQAVDQMRQELAASPASLADRGRIGRRLKHAEEMLGKAQAEIARNPLAWEGRVGMTSVVPLGTVDLGREGAVEAWGAQRTAQAEGSAQRHGLSKPQYLEPTERRQLAKSFEQGGEKGLGTIVLLRRAFGDKTQDVLAELGKDAPAGALLAELALKTGMTPAVLDAAEGLHIKAQAGHKHVAPEKAKALVYAREVVGSSLGQNAPYLDQALKVADAIYERRAYRDGKQDAFQPDIWKQALREALGEHEVQGRKYGGLHSQGWFSQSIVLPPAVPQDKAGAIIGALRPEDLPAPPLRGRTPLTPQELRGATLVTLEPGKYLVALGNPQSSDPKWATDGKGKAFVLDLDAALPSLRRRRPDLR